MRINVFEHICKYLRIYNDVGDNIKVADICNSVNSYVESRGRSINDSTVNVYLSILKKAGYLLKTRRGWYRLVNMPEDDLTYSIARQNAESRLIRQEYHEVDLTDVIERARQERDRQAQRVREREAEEARHRQLVEALSRKERLRNLDVFETDTFDTKDTEELIKSELENITDGKRKEKGKSFFFEESEFKI